jgi:hypothetical protein
VKERSVPPLAGAALVLLATLPARAQVPLGSEFQVSSYVTDRQVFPSVAMGPDGSFVVVWMSQGQDGSSYGIFGQRFAAGGARQGVEFRVNSYTTERQRNPNVAMDPTGSFVVVWQSFTQEAGFTNTGVFGQRYDASGAPLGAEFRANSFTTNDQQMPSVAIDASGAFVVVWESDGQGGQIIGQRYDAAGAPQGTEFQVNSYTTSFRLYPGVARDATGRFVVIWDSPGQDGDGPGVFGQRFDAAGTRQGGEFQVNTYTTGYQERASVAMDPAGGFVVIWNSYLQDGGDWGVFGQRYDASGSRRGGEFIVNSFTAYTEQLGNNRSSLASDADGSFVVVWHDLGQDGGALGVRGQRFDSRGIPRGAAFQGNTYIFMNQQRPTVASDGKREFVVVWESDTQDGDERGIFGQRFAADFIFADGFESGVDP